ncbi:MAG: hypothetical protein OEX14_03765 [Paracoccaceae bacterium]|nr:hypothetical protein [Paracoccaceae bacterium]
MSLRLAVLLCALLGLPATALWADDFTDGTSYYQWLSSHCGAAPSFASFSSSEYTTAIADATRASRAARRNGQHTRVRDIQQSVEKLKKCQAEERQKYNIGPTRNCDDVQREVNLYVLERLNFGLGVSSFSSENMNHARDTLRTRLQGCIREVFSKCVDPTKTSEVDRALDVYRMANFLSLSRPLEENEYYRFLTENDPDRFQLKFCTDTDYACRGSHAACNGRIFRIDEVMRRYLQG